MGDDRPARWSVMVDFDGVLNQYVTPWSGATEIPDPPVEGAIEWASAVMVEYTLVIQTTRAATHEGRVAVRDWLCKHGLLCGPDGLDDTGLVWDAMLDRLQACDDPEGDVRLVITDRKLPCLLYLDDRGWRFRGAFPTLQQIRRAKPWKTGDPLRGGAGERIRKMGVEQNKLQERIGNLKFQLREERRGALALQAALHEALHDALDETTCDFCIESAQE